KDAKARADKFIAAVRELEQIPGVEAAAGAISLPPNLLQRRTNYAAEGRAPEEAARGADLLPVTPGFFKALGIRVIAGRAFVYADDARAPNVVVINQWLAKRLFGGADPV